LELFRRTLPTLPEIVTPRLAICARCAAGDKVTT
jgi:hypothetical protein